MGIPFTVDAAATTRPQSSREPVRAWLAGIALGLGLGLGLCCAAPAFAADPTPQFTLSEIIPASGDGQFTITNNSSSFEVTALLVTGLGAYAGTDRPGWSAEAFFFGTDALNCQDSSGYSFGTGFCFALTDSSAGAGIAA